MSEATAVRRRRGNEEELAQFTGFEGEFVYNETTHRIHTQDNARAGGYPHALLTDVESAVEQVRKMTRTPLTTDTTFYVRQLGNDDNDGLAPEAAFASSQGALAALNAVDPRGKRSSWISERGRFRDRGPFPRSIPPIAAIFKARALGELFSATPSWAAGA